jgi:putative flippase GtrA
MPRKTANELMKYSVVAGTSASSDWLTFIVLNLMMDNLLVAQGLSRCMGGLVSFLLNRHWSFRLQKGKGVAVETRRFLIIYALSYVLSLTTFYLLFEVVSLSPYLAKLAADTLSMLCNFIVMKTYVFHDRAGISSFIGRAMRAISNKPRRS